MKAARIAAFLASPFGVEAKVASHPAELKAALARARREREA